jgi:hypothetical protein
MNKTLVAGLLACAATLAALYATQSESAVAVTEPPRALDAFTASSAPDLAMPPPQAPLDMTPITPYETVGAAHYEPF